MEKNRENQQYNSLRTVLINDINNIINLIEDDETLPKYKYINDTAWDQIKYEFAKVADNDEWLLFHSFYNQCDEWNRFLADMDMSTDLTEGIKPLKDIAKRIFNRD